MTTQFMSPTTYTAGTPFTGYNGYLNNRNGGFSFRKRVERVDWRKIASVDIDNISRTLDFNTLQDNIMNITFCNLEAEMDIRSVDPNFVKVFKLSQLTIEYLLHSQEYLAGLCATLEAKCQESDQKVAMAKKDIDDLQKELAEVKKESHRRKKLLIAQQQLMYAGNESYNKCPFCAKAFLNTNFLQSHINRRHTSLYKDGSTSVSPDLGVGSESARIHLEAELSQIKEQMLKQQVELEEEKKALKSLKNKEADHIEVQLKQSAAVSSELICEQQEEGETKMSLALMKEIKELTAKYQSSQKALLELEARTGNKRSYLGIMEDDTDFDRQEVKEQKMEIASMKEQLQQQLDHMRELMETKLEKQERKWQKKMHAVTRQHAQETKKLNNALDSTAYSQENISISQPAISQRQEVEQILKTEVKEMKLQQSKSPKVKSQQNRNIGQELPIRFSREEKVSGQSFMCPSDDESAGFGTGTSSLRTIGHETPISTLNQTGTLHTQEFLDGLRKNPTLALIREQLTEVLLDQIEKNGIPKTWHQDKNWHNIHQPHCRHFIPKLMHSSSCKKKNLRYPNFFELRELYNKRATDEARKQLKMQMKSPRGPPPAGPRRKLELSPRTPHQHQPFSSGPQSGPPHPQQNVSVKRTTPRSSSGPPISSTKPYPQPRAASAQRTPLSTGSTTEWTSTNFDSDESDENSAVSGRSLMTASKGRLLQSGPAKVPSPSPRTQVPKTRLIQSRPLNNNADDDLNDVDDILNSDRQPTRQNSTVGKVAALTKEIEKQLEARPVGVQPVGGVNTVTSSKKVVDVGDFEEESDWDSTTVQNDPIPLPQKRIPVNRASTDGMSTNTYASSAWGSTGNAASTAKEKERRSTSRSSHFSITSVSSDEDMNVDNI
ncbi:cilium assembly protein DZIP1L-like isoform X3 [Biomphalaria glabrata]|uniref:Cilium assembly protein DZIP1L-like isoform X3 n=1 Tax=Biomphalaria glabrata TaxID=6526 RepID=A0A9W2Z2C5_BIOGL|nr:cilium assembly protein DZIP1L-like isoform X3 [Biomphalaria glabrata]